MASIILQQMQFEEAATEVANEIMKSSLHTDEPLPTAQILLNWEASPVSLRELHSEQVSKLVKISGIVVSSSGVRAKATRLTLQCRGCRQYLPNLRVRPGFEGYMLPRKCPVSQTGGAGVSCPIDPYFIVPDKCKCVDYQVLKLQESPEYLVEKVSPGNRITVVGIFSIQTSAPIKPKAGTGERVNVGVRSAYVRVLGLALNNDGPGRSGLLSGSSAVRATASSGSQTEYEEADEIRKLANTPNIYDIIARSIAPSIYGSSDIKKAIACLLFGGSRKRLPDGLCRRGDINLLLLGDPGTAKSQLLKFVERCSPVGVYTSGKGSSAAGLTASITRDPVTRNFVMEGGAMVLADGGVVCIDEFDKMREDDRVAIHEAMEQQTISIAKAGITTSLNSRCSVLAAANSVFGRWDDTKGESNIDFMPTILSRFDMIFVVRDEHDVTRDTVLAHHVMQVHLRGNDPTASVESAEKSAGEIPLAKLRRFIAYARECCGPRLSPSAAEKLVNQYVLMRSGASRHEQQTGKRAAIPITVRQLEAVIRISESLAKMRLEAFANESDVDEALRLFQVSTLEAFMTGSLEGAEGFTSQEEHDLIVRVEKQLKRRFVIGSQVSEHAILQDFSRQGFSEHAVAKVLHYMIRRGEIQYRMQRRILYRVK
ncbi:minichromosome maintenance protein 5 [Sparganum proliferum]